MPAMSAPVPVVIPPENVWTPADQTLFERTRDDAMDAGKSTDRAEAIAARAVNDLRRAEGRAPAEPEPDPRKLPDALDVATREELYDRAKELDIPGRSRMTKEELVGAIRTKEAEAQAAIQKAEEDAKAEVKKAAAAAKKAEAKNVPAEKAAAKTGDGKKGAEKKADPKKQSEAKKSGTKSPAKAKAK